MKTNFVFNDIKYDIDYEINHYDVDNYFPVWKSWTKFEEILNNQNIFFKKIIISNENNEINIDQLNYSLKELILNKLFEEVMISKEKESKFFSYHYTGQIPSSAYRDLDFSWVDKSKKQILIKNFIDKNGSTIEIRQSGEKLKYVKKDSSGEIVRDHNGNAVYLSDEEILKKELPMYDTSVFAFNEDGTCVGYTSDEWGADGVWVLPAYQRRGIGVELLTIHRSQFKDSRKIGQMTDAGIRMVLSYFRKNYLE